MRRRASPGRVRIQRDGRDWHLFLWQPHPDPARDVYEHLIGDTPDEVLTLALKDPAWDLAQ